MALKLGQTDIDSIMLGTTAVQRVMLGAVQLWVWEKVVTLANATAVNIQSLFSTADWSSGARKRVIVPAGVTIGSTAVGTAALRTGSGFGGDLVVDVYGSVQGAGGAANGGAGGDAIQPDQNGGITINIHPGGSVYSGGGGGGRGGNGGNGSYNYTHREPVSGWSFSTNTKAWANSYREGGDGNWRRSWGASWAGVSAGGSSSTDAIPTSWASGGWTYLRGTYAGGWDNDPGNYTEYRIARQQTRSQSTTGGAGGNGGRGQGYSQSRANGSAGAAGGTNAGAGGTGGTGGLWGASGSQGATGGNGNVANGAAGAAGGLAGFAISNIARVVLNNNGTMLGR